MIPTLTPTELRDGIAREFEDMRANVESAHSLLSRGAVPPDEVPSPKYSYVRPAHLRTWKGE